MEQHLKVTAEPIQIVPADGSALPRTEHAISISYDSSRYASRARAEEVARAIERAINRALKTV